jgi:hypothetical protein
MWQIRDEGNHIQNSGLETISSINPFVIALQYPAIY